MKVIAAQLVSALAAADTAPRVAAAGLAPPQNLRVEGLSPATQDVVLSETRPRFGYHHAPLHAPVPFGVTQASYRVTVSARSGGQQLWDSGDVASNASSEIVYGHGVAGSPPAADLTAFSRYTFCVSWTATDPSLGASPQACANFETGPIAAADWQGAGWMVSHRVEGDVTNRTQFRSPVFTLPKAKKVEFARLYVAAAGCAHVEVNGAVPLPDLRGICPWPVQTSGVRYVTHHLTDDDAQSPVQHGITLGEQNVIGVIAGHVMKAPQFIALLMVKYVGESAPFFLSTSDSGWTTAVSHVLPQPEVGAASHATQYFGAWDTTIDWTKYQQGWSTPTFKPDSRWVPAGAPVPAVGEQEVSARALAMPLSTVLDEVLPDSVTKLPDGDFLYHFPKNFVGTLRINTAGGESGAHLTVLLGEWLLPHKPVAPPPPAPHHPPPPPPGPPSHCGRVVSGRTLNLGCAKPGTTIDKIVFASFGTPGGNCSVGFKKWYAGPYAPHGDKICDSNASVPALEKACLGKHTCSITAPAMNFPLGTDPCQGVHKMLAAEVHCTGDPPGAACEDSCYDYAPPPAPKPPVPPPAPLPPPGPAAHCGIVDEKHELHLGCSAGKTIDKIVFASFGTPRGSCNTGFHTGDDPVGAVCNANNSMAVVERACLGKQSCLLTACLATRNGVGKCAHNSSQNFGHVDPCINVPKQLAAEIHCSGDPPGASCKDSCYASSVPSPWGTPGGYPHISGNKEQYENHVLSSSYTKPLETLFCWHGFQYVRISSEGNTGFKGGLRDIVGLEIHTNMSQTGKLDFDDSDAGRVLNGVNQMTLQSQRTNVAAYMPTDCPTREKHGWMGDALDASEQSMYNFATAAVHEAFIQTIIDNQGPNGDVPTVVPNGFPHNDSCNDIAWTSVFPQLTNMMHSYHGNTRLIQRHWQALVNYQENLIRVASSDDGLAQCDKYNDWLCGTAQSCCSGEPQGSSCDVGHEMGGFNYILGLQAMSEMAGAIGNTTLEQRYSILADKARHTFHSDFYNPTLHAYGGDNGAVQTLTSPAIKIEAPPTSMMPAVIKTLQNDFATLTNFTPRVGAVTSKIILNVLSENGLHRTAVRAATATTMPSWGWWWTQNATTCWEAFPGGGATRNHIFLCGGIGHWMWKHLVGLEPTTPGFATVRIAPKIDGTYGPKSVRGEFLSPSGLIKSSWTIVSVEDGQPGVSLNISLPIGVHSAEVTVPAPPAPESTWNLGVPVGNLRVLCNGKAVWSLGKFTAVEGVKTARLSSDGAAVVFGTTNGIFTFASYN